MGIIIRKENSTELSVICNLIEKAFADMPESDHQEHYLADRLHIPIHIYTGIVTSRKN